MSGPYSIGPRADATPGVPFIDLGFYVPREPGPAHGRWGPNGPGPMGPGTHSGPGPMGPEPHNGPGPMGPGTQRPGTHGTGAPTAQAPGDRGPYGPSPMGPP